MRLFLIALASLILFFPTFWVLHPVFGQKWASIVASATLFFVFPVALLLIWNKPANGPFFKFCNYGLAVIVLSLLCWVIYLLLTQQVPAPNSLSLIGVYGYAALYFLRRGYMPYQAAKMNTKNVKRQIK